MKIFNRRALLCSAALVICCSSFSQAAEDEEKAGKRPPPNVSLRALAHIFGHVKNARLTSKDQNAQDQGGHVKWAENQKIAVVVAEVDSDLDVVESQTRSDLVDPSRWGDVFGHVKNAYSVAAANDPAAQEDLQKHKNWAQNHTTSQVKSEIKRYIQLLREKLL